MRSRISLSGRCAHADLLPYSVATLGSTSTGTIDKIAEITAVSEWPLFSPGGAHSAVAALTRATCSRKVPRAVPPHRRGLGWSLLGVARVPERSVPRRDQRARLRPGRRRRHLRRWRSPLVLHQPSQVCLNSQSSTRMRLAHPQRCRSGLVTFDASCLWCVVSFQHAAVDAPR